jgi:hypothetical protein
MKQIIKSAITVILGGCAIAGALAFVFDKQVTVESNHGKYKSVNVKTGGQVRLIRRISSTPCVEGKSWGFDSNHIWVDKGCRAVFEYAGVTKPSHDQKVRRDRGPYRTVTVESTGQRVSLHIENHGVELLKKLSKQPCEQGKSWGFDSQGIWVDRGCRAKFSVKVR